MKFTRTILFLLMFVLVSACNSTIPTLIISPTNTSSPIMDATVTSTFAAPTETATVVAPMDVEAGLNPDLKNEQLLPVKPLEYFISQGFFDQVKKWENEGNFPLLKGVPFTKLDNFKYPPDGDHGTLFSFDSKIPGTGTYWHHPENVPNNNVLGAWQIEGSTDKFKTYYVLLGVKNKDGELNGYQGIYARPPKNMPLDAYLRIRGLGSGESMLSGIYFATLESCRQYFSYAVNGGDPNESFCKWYFANLGITVPENIYQRLASTGLFSNEVTINGRKQFIVPVAPAYGQQMPVGE